MKRRRSRFLCAHHLLPISSVGWPTRLDSPPAGRNTCARHMVSRGVHDMRHTTARVGADVGGTFTDIVLVDAERGITLQKLPSTPDDFGRAIVDGVANLLSTDAVAQNAIGDVVHGTTVATT